MAVCTEIFFAVTTVAMPRVAMDRFSCPDEHQCGGVELLFGMAGHLGHVTSLL